MAVVENDMGAKPETSAAALAVHDAAYMQVWRNRLLAMILGLLLLTLCAIAARVVVPVLVAILISVMLAPAVRWMTQWHVPRAFASMLVLALAIATGGLLLNALAKPALDWVAHAPKAIEQFSHQVQALWRPIADASKKATEQITHMSQSGPNPQPVPVVDSSTPDALFQLLSAAPAVIMEMLITLLLVFVFLQHGDAVLRKLVELAPDWHAKRGVVVATRDAQRDLSVYVFTISMINTALGIATAGAMWALGVPDAVLWGCVAAAFNFAPYIGPLLTVAALSVVGITSAHSLLLGLAPPAAFLALHLVESFVVTPLLAGRRLALDPIMIFLSLLLFGWMWGIPGLLIAVPLLTCLKIIASRVPAWAPLAKLLSA
ncbi:MAG TPA: AI-2E family transporter [Rudaea sp.]|nr:AI-2E family transporter [Rudaea sp.]